MTYSLDLSTMHDCSDNFFAFPIQLRHTDVLNDIKDWDLKELNIDENPLCGKYQTQPEYVR